MLTGITLVLAMALQADPAPDRAGFEKAVAPFLRTHCVTCHGPKKKKGKLTLHDINPDLFSGPHVEAWIRVREKLTLREMPPEDEPPPDAAGRKRVIDWISGELSRAGRSGDDKLLLPGYGNYIDHDALFGGTAPEATGGSVPRLWRLNPHVYSSIVYDISRLSNLAQPFSLESGGGRFSDFSVLYRIDGPTTETLLRNANRVASEQVRTATDKKTGKLRGGPRTPREVWEIIRPDNEEPTDDQIAAAITRQYHLVLQRDPGKAEMGRLLAFTRKTMEDTGRVTAVRTMLAAVLLNPEVLYRSERGAGKPDARGRVMLAPREIAYAVAYALTDRRPDGPLLKAADGGKLSSPGDVRREVTRLLDHSRTAKPRIMRFFREYFDYPAAEDVFKDRKLNPQHHSGILVRDTEQLIQYILDRDRDVLKELLTTNKSFVNCGVDSKRKTRRIGNAKMMIHTSYGLPPDWKWTEDQPVDLPGSERAGILTQPSWLVAHSDNFDNHAIRRGKWIREKLLGGTVPDLPITVDAQLPEDKTLTLRQRMEVTKKEYCWKCHRRMNPLGLPFERFDHFGRYRTRELGRPVDTSGLVEDSGDPALEGKIEDPVAFIRKLAGSRRVRQVFIRHVFRYFMGRNETEADGPTLVRAEKDYVDSGGSFRALVVSLLTSDAFLYRVYAE